MYVWIWHHLPGRTSLRALQALVLAGLVTAALFVWAFPWVESQLPYSDVTVPGPASSVGPTGSPSDLPTELPAG